jgi:hypothetical protein
MNMTAERCSSQLGNGDGFPDEVCAPSTANRRLCAITRHWPKTKSRRQLHYNWRAVCAVCGSEIVKLEPSGSWRTLDRVKWVDPRLSL